MAVDSILCTARAGHKKLRQDRCTEQHRCPQHIDGSNVSEPCRAAGGRGGQILRQGYVKVIICEPSGDKVLQILHVIIRCFHISEVSEHTFNRRFSGTRVEESDRRHIDPFGDDLIQVGSFDLVFEFADKIHHIAVHDGIRCGNEVAVNVSGLGEQIEVGMPVVEIRDNVQRLFELG